MKKEGGKGAMISMDGQMQMSLRGLIYMGEEEEEEACVMGM